MQPGGQAGDASAGQVALDGGHERVASQAVAAARLAQVAVVGTALDHARQCELLQRGRAVVGEVALVRDPLDELRRQQQPSQPQRRGQRLARRPHVDDAFRRQALQRSERRAVVAVLGVVVVLKHEAAAGGPLQKLGAARRRHGDAGRRLVSGRDEHRVELAGAGRDRVQLADPGAVGVDRQRAQAGAVRGQDRAVRRQSGVLDGDVRRTQGAGEQDERLGGAGADDDPLRVGDGAAHAAQVLGQGAAQLGRTARVGIPKRFRRHRRERLAHRP